MKQQSESVNDLILRLATKLSKHFSVELTDDQLEIFVHALANCTTYQVATAFERCLNECEFMPKLADVHKRMPEEKWPRRDTGFTAQRPILDVVREVVYEIYPDYDSLDTVRDARQIHDLFARANRLRYERMGIDTSKWGPVEPLHLNIKVKEQ